MALPEVVGEADPLCGGLHRLKGRGSQPSPAENKITNLRAPVAERPSCSRLYGKGSITMPTPSEYRLMAEECLRWARQARSDDVRDPLIELARVWTEAASKLDGSAPISSSLVSSVAAARRPGSSSK